MPGNGGHPFSSDRHRDVTDQPRAASAPGASRTPRRQPRACKTRNRSCDKGSFMTCKDFHTLAPLYLSGELDKSLADIFDSHRKTCAACERDFNAHRELDAVLLRSI